MGLAQELRDGTRRSHTAAERTAFVKGFLRGVVSREQYAALLGRLWHVYHHLEESLERHAAHPVVSRIHFPELRRQEALVRDLRHFGSEPSPPSPAASAYISRLQHLADHSPELLCAHSYVRYLGDLSGGQILRGIASRALHLPPGAGVEFYDFPLIPDSETFKKNYRSALDTLPLSPALQAEIVAEANHAFQLNIALFDELSGSAFLAFLKSLRPAPSAPLREKKVETRVI